MKPAMSSLNRWTEVRTKSYLVPGLMEVLSPLSVRPWDIVLSHLDNELLKVTRYPGDDSWK